MPNHVTNQITVTGPAESLAAFRAALLVPGEADSYGRDDRHPPDAGVPTSRIRFCHLPGGDMECLGRRSADCR